MEINDLRAYASRAFLNHTTRMEPNKPQREFPSKLSQTGLMNVGRMALKKRNTSPIPIPSHFVRAESTARILNNQTWGSASDCELNGGGYSFQGILNTNFNPDPWQDGCSVLY